MIGQCELCKTSNVGIDKSHIIPSFVGKWIKKSPVTQKFRSPIHSGRRFQDLYKDHRIFTYTKLPGMIFLSAANPEEISEFSDDEIAFSGTTNGIKAIPSSFRKFVVKMGEDAVDPQEH